MFSTILSILGWAFLIWLVYLAFSTLVIPRLMMLRQHKAETWLEDHPAERFDGPVDGEHGPDEAAIMSIREDALALRLELLEKATERVDMLYYQLTKDDSGDIILGQLLDVANRGVKVRLVIDATGSGYRLRNRKIAWALHGHPNVQFRLFSQVSLWRPWTVHNLLHEKMILVDNKLLLVSGRNIVDRFLEPGHPEEGAVQDFDILVRSRTPKFYQSVIPQAVQHFDDCWNAGQTRLAVHNFTEKKKVEGQYIVGQLISRARRLATMHTTYFGGLSVWDRLEWRPTSRITFLSNNVNEIYKTPRLWAEITRMMNRSKKQVRFLSPYFIPTKSMQRYLDYEHLRTIDVRLLTNSAGSTPNLLAFGGYMNRRKNLLKEGRKIFEYQGPGCIHAKVMTFDHRYTMIGSFNADARSTYLSCEIMLLADSPELTADMNARIERLEQYSSLQSDLELEGYLPSENVEERAASKGKRAQLLFFRTLALVFDYLL